MFCIEKKPLSLNSSIKTKLSQQMIFGGDYALVICPQYYITLKYWSVHRRFFSEQTTTKKALVFIFVFVFLLTHEQAMNEWLKKSHEIVKTFAEFGICIIIEWRVVRCLPPYHLFSLLHSCLVRTITYEGGSSVAYTVRIRNLANVPLLYLLGLPKFAKSSRLSIFSFFAPKKRKAIWPRFQLFQAIF